VEVVYAADSSVATLIDTLASIVLRGRERRRGNRRASSLLAQKRKVSKEYKKKK
jgi:hypothetical protein